jgi:hypothetical protein
MLEREGSQQDTMWSPPPAAPPSHCDPPAKQRTLLHTAPLSLLPMVRSCRRMRPLSGVLQQALATTTLSWAMHQATERRPRPSLMRCQHALPGRIQKALRSEQPVPTS